MAKIIRVVRTLEYVGDETWVIQTLEKSWVSPSRPQALANGATVREIGDRTMEIVAEDK